MEKGVPQKTDEDILSLVQDDQYWGEFPEEEMDVLLGLLKEGKDEEARNLIEQKLNRTDFIYGKGRSNFIYYLNLNKDAVSLDCGSGLGVHTFNLAPYVKEVHSFDQSLKRVQFCNYRKKIDEVPNVILYHSDFKNLPFKDNTFDNILMNGVVEWLGEINENDNPREDQLTVLRSMYEKLRSGGKLYIGIENRYAAAYLNGYDHSGLPYTNFYPRWLADIVTKIKLKKPYRTYTYSIFGYRKLMKDAGFSPEKVEYYIAFPGYNLPQYIIPFDDVVSLQFFLLNMSKHKGVKGVIIRFFARSLLFVKIFRYIVFSYLIYAEK